MQEYNTRRNAHTHSPISNMIWKHIKRLTIQLSNSSISHIDFQRQKAVVLHYYHHASHNVLLNSRSFSWFPSPSMSFRLIKTTTGHKWGQMKHRALPARAGSSALWYKLSDWIFILETWKVGWTLIERRRWRWTAAGLMTLEMENGPMNHGAVKPSRRLNRCPYQ